MVRLSQDEISGTVSVLFLFWVIGKSGQTNLNEAKGIFITLAFISANMPIIPYQRITYKGINVPGVQKQMSDEFQHFFKYATSRS